MSGKKDNNILKRVFSGSVNSIASFIEEYYNYTIDSLNNTLSSLSLTYNFNSQLIEGIEITAGQTLQIDHRLKTIPAYRITVKQSGNGLITDGDFTNKYINLINNGASTVTLSIMLFKE